LVPGVVPLVVEWNIRRSWSSALSGARRSARRRTRGCLSKEQSRW